MQQGCYIRGGGVTRSCLHCGADYEPVLGFEHQRYCSRRCKHAAKVDRAFAKQKPCIVEGCSEPRIRASSRCQSHWADYMRERMRERNGSSSHPCEMCGKGELWQPRQRFCDECRIERGRRAAAARYQRVNEMVDCPVCGQRFHRGHGRRMYCGQRCSSRASRVTKLLGLPADVALPIYRKFVDRAGGHCEMCGIPFERAAGFTPSGSSGALDHCHVTHVGRGLLCGGCNTSLGKYEKHRENAERYLAMAALDLRDLCLRA